MKISVTKNLIKKLPQYKSKPKDWEERFDKNYRWVEDDEFFDIELESFSEKEIEILQEEAAKIDEPKYRSLVNKIIFYNNVEKNPLGAIDRLEGLKETAKRVIGKTPNKWLFSEEFDGNVIAYFVYEIEYEQARSREPAHVSFSLKYIKDGSVESRGFTFYQADLKKGASVVDLLTKKGYYLETKELTEVYMKEVERYKQIHSLTGSQFLAKGKAEIASDNRWDRGSIIMERDGQKTRVIMDDLFVEDKESSRDGDEVHYVDTAFWTNKRKNDEEDNSVIPPLHPYVRIFDLMKHRFLTIHVNNLEEYIYDTTISEKLVLPKFKKDLVDILVQGTGGLLEDIIKGKTGGIIVLATGVPGTGKTLTAEVYAETVKKPLYVVQCSQLGTDPDELEKKLTEVLSRAVRWNAILLIDEADVYIYERGASIKQNAIVGVFLRVLEYYRGVLFLTSNRATIIDDAILSRTTAHIQYEIPSEEEAKRIWEVLRKQFGIKLENNLVEYAKAFPNISGRTIKNLLKLTKLLADREKKPITVELVSYASQFLDGVKEVFK